MPFELGVFFGAKRFGSQQHRNKNALILERNKYSYQQYISDLNGIDTKAHNIGLDLHDIPFNDYCEIVEAAAIEKSGH